MIGQAVLLGSAKNEIRLATRAKRDIPNEIIVPPSPAELSKATLFVQLHGSKWRMRKDHCGGYNCAGHVWASRRTGIFDPAQVPIILQDDGYRALRAGEACVEGDLVLYWGSSPGDTEEWLHVGVVCEIRPIVNVGLEVWVLSKFGATIGEFLHLVDDVPYPNLGFVSRFDYQTGRP